MFRNRRLLFQIVALEFNDRHTIQKNAVNLGQIIRTENEHHLAQIDGDARQIFVLKVAVLNRIGQVNHEVHHLLSLGRLRDLVHFIEHQHGAHRFGRDEGVHNLSTVRGLIDQLMARIGARI